MFGAKRLRMKPVEAMMAPMMVTRRHPYLLVKALAIGPVNINRVFKMIIYTQLPQRDLYICMHQFLSGIFQRLHPYIPLSSKFFGKFGNVLGSRM